MLAQIHEKDRLARIYAYECIDILDLHRQMYVTEVKPLSSHDLLIFTRMENDCKDIIDNIEKAKIQRRALANSASRGIDQQFQFQQIDQDTATTDSNAIAASYSKPQRKWKFVGQVVDSKTVKSGELQIEGFLRVGRDYKPVEKYVPLSREPHDIGTPAKPPGEQNEIELASVPKEEKE